MSVQQQICSYIIIIIGTGSSMHSLFHDPPQVLKVLEEGAVMVEVGLTKGQASQTLQQQEQPQKEQLQLLKKKKMKKIA